MGLNTQAKAFLESAKGIDQLTRLYGTRDGAVEKQTARYARLADWHMNTFGEKEMKFVSAPGRTEIAGNHTDHNHGRVLAAAVNLDTVAAVSANDTGVVTLYSDGYDKPFVVDLANLTPVDGEQETTYSLIRGVAARMKELGYVIGGFDAVVTSTVFKGSGLSSSAAFEVLICAIIDTLYNDFVVNAKLRAQIAQYEAQLSQQSAMLSEKAAQLEAANSAGLIPSEVYQAGLAEIAAGEKVISDSQKELAAQSAALDAAQEQIEQGRAEMYAWLTENI